MSKSNKFITQNNIAEGKIIKATKCWWIKINQKPVRKHTFDGAVFPYILTFTYTVNDITYKKRKCIVLSANAINILGNINVDYNKENPSKCAIQI